MNIGVTILTLVSILAISYAIYLERQVIKYQRKHKEYQESLKQASNLIDEATEEMKNFYEMKAKFLREYENNTRGGANEEKTKS